MRTRTSIPRSVRPWIRAAALVLLATVAAPTIGLAQTRTDATFIAGSRTFAGDALLVDRMATNHYQVFGVQRTGPGAVEFHALDTDIVMVLDGSATFVTGGRISDERERVPNERTGSGITGGTEWALATGDVIVIPNGLPHWFKQVDGRIRYCAVKIRQERASPGFPSTVKLIKGADAFSKNGLVLDVTEGRFARVYALRRTQPLGVELHGVDTDVVFVTDGAGTFVTGGTISEPRALRENEGTGATVVGGAPQPLVPGAVLVVPSGVPHWLRDVNGGLDFFAVKVH